MLSGILSTLKPANLAKLSTSRAPVLKGLLPTSGTLLTLLMVSLAMTAGIWLWTGAIASLTALIPAYLTAIASISGAALLNFFFSLEINTAMLSSRPNRKGNKYSAELVNLKKLVEEVRTQLNTHFEEVYGAAHVDLPMPRLCVYTSEKARLQAVLGATPEDTGLFFSSTFFDSHNTRWNDDHIKALVAHQLVQAYHRRGWGSTIVSIGASFLFTLQSLQESDQWYFRALGLLAGPFQFFFFVQKAIERSYSYEAVTHVKNMYRGKDYFDAIDIKVCPSLVEQNSYSYLRFDHDLKKRTPYSGLFSSWLRPITDWIDEMELTEDNKSSHRIISGIRSIVREAIYSINEMNSSDPRTTRVKDHLRDEFRLGRLYTEYLSANHKNVSLNVFLEGLVRQGIIDNIAKDGFYESLYARINKKGFRISQDEIIALGNCSFRQLPQEANVLSKIMKVLSDAEMATLGRADRIGRGEPAEPVVVVSEIEVMRAQLEEQGELIRVLMANQQHNVAPQPAAPAAVPPFVPQQQQQAAASPRIMIIEDYDSGNDGQTERNRRQFG
jgi:Zn-dependent protease with chaperone function